MLAESFLTSIAYKTELCASHECQRLQAVAGESWNNPFEDAEVHGGLHQESEKKAPPCPDTERRPEACRQKLLPTKRFSKIPLSPPQRIPRKEQPCEKRLDLYRSWSSQSLYQNYPDLHIGGDHIADHTCDSGCIMDQCHDELSAGPVLFSRDIPSRYSSVNEPLQILKTTKSYHGDESRERTITLYKEPLSNSIINNYIEGKVQELYKQVLEEKLTRCGSITHPLVTNLLMMNNIGEMPHDQPAGPSKALLHSLAVFGLQNGSFGQSSEFATPNLQISPPLCKRKPSFLKPTL
ncbi:hypothetical protein JRQ81_007207 [Phrynocephalus forsythii]|uniref:Uncharacterized protein n=1 Tax=Phrynocephalus forsythii TaxID=171643 RepID=A0A9Q0XDC4_9SAUR|nr:hypothetical protein JRQ81_007207 [Phrynocephalus forsythii]